LFPHIITYFRNNEPLHCPKGPLTILLHFTSSSFSLILSPPSNHLLSISTIHFPLPQFLSHFIFIAFTSLYFAIHIHNSLHFPSLVFTFLTLVLKICVLPLEVPIDPSGSLFVSNGPIHKGVFPDVCSLFSVFDFPIIINLYLLCDMISRSIIKCVVYKELKLWLRLEEINFALEHE
jgi:hypothetical protein